MLLSILALLTPVQDAPVLTANMRCSVAIIAKAARAGNLNLKTLTQANHFLLVETRNDRRGMDYLERYKQIAGLIQQAAPTFATDPAFAPDKLDAMIAACTAREPLALRDTLPALPADAFDRDMLCLNALSFQAGVADGAEMAEDHEHLSAVASRYESRVSDERAAEHGIDTQEKAVTAAGKAIIDSLSIGNLDTVARACEAALSS